MQLREAFDNIQWAWVPYFYISCIVIGMYIGSPLAAKYYKLNISTEVDAFFFLMPVMYFFLSLPLCILAAAGISHPRISSSKFLKIICIGLCTFLVPTVFYGIGVSLYYSN